MCPAGHYCPNTTIALPCPPGQWCAVGQSRGTPCEPDLFGALSAADRCPGQGHHPDGGGSRSPPSQKSWLLWLLIGAVPFVIVVELASVWERRRRGRKRAEGLDLMPDIDASDAQYSGMDAQQPNDMDDTAWRLAWLSRAGGAGLRSSEGEPSPVRRSDSSLASSWGWKSPLSQGKPSPKGNSPKGHSPKSVFAAAVEQHAASLEESLEASFAPVMGKGRTFTHVELRSLDFHIGKALVLQSLSANLTHGELVALMGESGSGKTTLLNILGGRASYGRQSGELLLNGSAFNPNKSRHLIGYVPQAHILFKELTVFENLMYAAELRLVAPREDREHLIEMALDLLGLQECRHFVCDPAIGERLSGGQMRRIGIGMELVCNPPIMLLDEPTSALDAVNTRLVVAALKGLAKQGVLVVASLHQPRHAVYEMLDRLLLLRKGELIYGGPKDDALTYFSGLGFNLPRHANPADFFIEVAFGFEASERPLADLLSLAHETNDHNKAASSPNRAEVDPKEVRLLLSQRLPNVPHHRLLEAIKLAGQHSGKAYALLLTPCESLSEAVSLWEDRPHCNRLYNQIAELRSSGGGTANRAEFWSEEMRGEAASKPKDARDQSGGSRPSMAAVVHYRPFCTRVHYVPPL